MDACICELRLRYVQTSAIKQIIDTVFVTALQTAIKWTTPMPLAKRSQERIMVRVTSNKIRRTG
jgi:ribosomal protein S10